MRRVPAPRWLAAAIAHARRRGGRLGRVGCAGRFGRVGYADWAGDIGCALAGGLALVMAVRTAAALLPRWWPL